MLDTNAYLRLAKRIIPLLGQKFGQKEYILTILKDVEKEVCRSARLTSLFPWFDDSQYTQERVSTTLRFSPSEKQALAAATSVLREHVVNNVVNYKTPPSLTDCRVLAMSMVRDTVAATDDKSMHTLAKEFSLPVWHGWEVLKKMHTAKMVSDAKVLEIYDALEMNGDLPKTWAGEKEKAFIKVFRSRKVV